MSTLLSWRRRAICTALLGAMACVPSFGATAAEFPGGKPIRLVVPFVPGGQTDSLARMLAFAMAEELRGTVVVENIPGAAGTLGVGRVARAEPDGYTLVMGVTATQAIAPALYPSLAYKPERDFVAIGKAGNSPLVVLANPRFPANNIQEMLALARKNNGQLQYAAWGVGSGGHLLMESVNHHANVKLAQVPYKGEAPIFQALIGGEVEVGVASVGGALPFIKSGRIKALNVSGSQRSSLLPNIPTLAEQGVPFKSSAWYGVFAPAKTPPRVTEILSRALAAVIARPKVQEKMRDLGIEAGGISREAFVQEIKKDTLLWGKIVAESGTKLE
ncbi:ABC transporter substrate-binding protein [Cupriavidus oxalaticus]|uniref:Bug family tripartite tricarboxylate transporter substrate binding protein n=1 Tax=Cupriavidus oxalaticus TaxID=96344 RepID=UPI003F7357C7